MADIPNSFDQSPDAKVASHTAQLPAAPVPDGMKLLQVIVMFRHGDKIDADRYQNIFPSYPIESLSRCFKLFPESREGAPAGQGTPGDWEWKHGALTDIGHARLRHFGEQLRKAFVESTPLLSDARAPDELYLWSRDMPRGRTWCSLQEVLQGLWPTLDRTLEDMGTEVGGRKGCSVPVCPFPVFSTADIQVIAAEWHDKYCPDKSSAAERPAVKALIEEAKGLGCKGSIMHQLLMRIAYSLQHGEALPPGFTAEDYRAIAKACNKAEIALYTEVGEMKKTLRQLPC